MLGRPLNDGAWPWYLEGAFFWRGKEGINVAYRDWSRSGITEPLCSLDQADVIEFARREVARTVGLDSGARFFLAGGAFKSLITGRPPRDLDLWAPSTEDRLALIGALEQRGADRLPERPFADAFEIDGRIVEVPRKVEPTSLEGRLGQFDIGLSAVGVEHRPGDKWSAIIHPLAMRSIQRREVLLLKPLVNWKYALGTLERLRRYAIELQYSVPEQEEQEIWRVFEGQAPEMRSGMLDRYAKTAIGGFGVAEEAACRFP